MAKSVSSKFFTWDGHRLSRFTMSVQADFSRNFADGTCYEDNAVDEVPGVMVREFVTKGASAGAYEFEALEKLAGDGSGPFILPMFGSTAHGAAVVVQDARLKTASLLGARDALSPFDLSFSTLGDWLTGQIFLESLTGAPTGAGTANSAGIELGAAPLGVWLAVNAVDIPGITGTSPTLTVILQSDVDDTWASPADIITISSITDIPDGVLVLDTDAITDTFFRVQVVVGGTSTPTYPLQIAAGKLA